MNANIFSGKIEMTNSGSRTGYCLRKGEITMYLSDLDLMLESIYMAMDEHGIKCDDGHWMTEEELFSLPEAAVIKLFNQIYGRG